MRAIHSLLSFAILSASSLVAQRTWIVDAGGNGDFRTVSAAFTAASDGDTVLVRAGSYMEAPVTAKALTVLGEGGPVLDGLRVEKLAASRTFVAKGLSFRDLGSGVQLFNNPGRVHLERIFVPSFFLPLQGTPALGIENCALVSVTGCDFTGTPGASVSKSSAYFVDSKLTGTQGYISIGFSRSAAPGLHVSDSVVTVAATDCTGGAGTKDIAPNPPAAGIRLWRGEVAVTGSSATRIVAGQDRSGKNYSAPAIEASIILPGKVFLDRRVQLVATNTTQLVKFATPVLGTLPALVASGVAPGKSAKTELFAPSGWTSGLVVGLPGYRRPLPPFGDLLLDAPTIVLDVGVVGAGGSRIVRVPFPAAIPRGTAATFQALTLAPSFVLQLSTAVTVVLD